MSVHRYHRAGFTLVELVTSLAIMSVLMFGMASAVMLSTRAIPSAQGALQEVRRTATVLDELAEDLRVAEYITERTANAITFTVPDRDKDGRPEVIRYAWSGTAGHPLQRFYNSSPGASVLEDIRQFDLTYDTASEVETYEGIVSVSSEMELASHTVGTPTLDYHVQQFAWPAQYFEPSLPGDAVSWSATRAFVLAEQDGMDFLGETWVQLRLPDDGDLPSDTVLEQKLMRESNLWNSYQWEEFTFSKATSLAPDRGLCLVLEAKTGDHTAHIAVEAGAGHADTLDRGANWSSKSETLFYSIYGTAVTRGTARTLTRDHVTGVRIAARAGPSTTAAVETTVPTLNRPEALSAVWIADFEADPTTLDLDLDANADWKVPGDLPFNDGQRANGAWLIDVGIQTNPGHVFKEPTTVDMRLWDTAEDGEAGGVKIRVDRDADTYAFIRAEAETDGAGGQTVRVITYDPGLNLVTVVDQSGFPNDWIDVRILVEPGSNHLNVNINDDDFGTYPYGRITASTESVIFLYETANISGLTFDDFRVRVGGTP